MSTFSSTSGLAIVLGESLRYQVSTVEEVDLTNTIVSLVFDGPGLNRIVMVYNPDGGGDGVLVDDGTAIRFEKTSVWVADNFSAGNWTVRLAVGPPETWQFQAGTSTLLITKPRQGDLPTEAL